MAFRNSSLPDWSFAEKDGYYSSRSRSTRSSEASSPPGSPREVRGVLSATQQKLTFISKDLRREEIKIKVTRLLQPLGVALGLQGLLLVVFSFLFPQEHWAKKDSGLYYYLGVTYLYNASNTFFSSFLSSASVVLAILTYVIMFMIATCLQTIVQYPETIHEQLRRYLSPRFLLKPPLFGIICLLHCILFINMFDSTYANMYLIQQSPDDESYKQSFLRENLLVVRLSSFFTGIEFFLCNFFRDGFCLSFPVIRVLATLSSMIDIDEFPKRLRESLPTTFMVWISCLLLGPIIYSPLFSMIGLSMLERTFVNRLFLFLDLGFILRLILWVYLPRLYLNLYLSFVNSCLTDMIHLPIESPPSNNRCLLLSEAMKSENAYLKYLSFYDFNLKSDSTHPDVLVFFNVTHPGNHPLNWKGVFTASCSLLTKTNEDIIKFLKGTSLPVGILQAGLQPYVLSKLKKDDPYESTANAKLHGVQEPVDPSKANMKDLASTFQTEFPKGPPTVYDLVSQLPVALWGDLKDAFRGLVTMQNVNNLFFLGRLDSKLPEKQVSNLLSDRFITIWGMVGCLKLIVFGLEVDKRGIVHQDIKCFVEKVLETHDTLQALDFYVCNALDKDHGIDRSVLLENRRVITMMIHATVFVLTRLHGLLLNCYSILGVDSHCQSRLQEIASF